MRCHNNPHLFSHIVRRSHPLLCIQEIIQNADDAGASTVHFYLDSRQHRSQSLIYPSIGQFQGPSLLSYNDAMFQAKDWQSIQDMQQSVKAEDPFKVGKFGIGFNSVYHITGLFWGCVILRMIGC